MLTVQLKVVERVVTLMGALASVRHFNQVVPSDPMEQRLEFLSKSDAIREIGAAKVIWIYNAKCCQLRKNMSKGWHWNTDVSGEINHTNEP